MSQAAKARDMQAKPPPKSHTGDSGLRLQGLPVPDVHPSEAATEMECVHIHDACNLSFTFCIQ